MGGCGDVNNVVTPLYVVLSLTPAQECVVYLCGTKYDLVEENKKARKVDASLVRDYVDGEWKVRNTLVYMVTACM